MVHTYLAFVKGAEEDSQLRPNGHSIGVHGCPKLLSATGSRSQPARQAAKSKAARLPSFPILDTSDILLAPGEPAVGSRRAPLLHKQPTKRRAIRSAGVSPAVVGASYPHRRSPLGL